MVNDKNDRYEHIKRLISEQDIKNQDELLRQIREAGFQITQATLSRDLKRMKISKVANTYGDYVYVLPNHSLLKKGSSLGTAEAQPRYGFVSLNFSGNMAVIKTKPGYASSLAFDIDNHAVPGILGTIAGDDTILMVLSENVNRTELKHLLEPIIVYI